MRFVLQGLILAGVIWLANSMSTQNVQMAGVQVQLAILTKSVEGMPLVKEQVTQLQDSDREHERRIAILEREPRGGPAEKRLKGFIE